MVKHAELASSQRKCFIYYLVQKKCIHTSLFIIDIEIDNEDENNIFILILPFGQIFESDVEGGDKFWKDIHLFHFEGY